MRFQFEFIFYSPGLLVNTLRSQQKKFDHRISFQFYIESKKLRDDSLSFKFINMVSDQKKSLALKLFEISGE